MSYLRFHCQEKTWIPAQNRQPSVVSHWSGRWIFLPRLEICFLTNSFLLVGECSHLEYQIVTPRTLKDLKSDTLVLQDVRILNDLERSNCSR